MNAQLDIVFNDHDAMLGNLVMFAVAGCVAETILPDDRGGMQGDPSTNVASIVDGHIRVQDTVFANRDICSNIDTGIEDSPPAHHGTSFDRHMRMHHDAVGDLGVLMDIFFGRRLVVTPNFAPSLYWKGTSGKDLGHPLEFRSGLEIAYRFDDRSRLGLAVHHLSNASISDDNPGTELLTLYYSLPMDGLFGK